MGNYPKNTVIAEIGKFEIAAKLGRPVVAHKRGSERQVAEAGEDVWTVLGDQHGVLELR